MNDGGDCRTAPATPGLLNMFKYQNFKFLDSHIYVMHLPTAMQWHNKILFVDVFYGIPLTILQLLHLPCKK